MIFDFWFPFPFHFFKNFIFILFCFVVASLLERIRGQVEHRSCSNQHILDALTNTQGQLEREERYDAGVKDRDVAKELVDPNFSERVEEEGHCIRPGRRLRRLGVAEPGEIFNQVL